MTKKRIWMFSIGGYDHDGNSGNGNQESVKSLNEKRMEEMGDLTDLLIFVTNRFTNNSKINILI